MLICRKGGRGACRGHEEVVHGVMRKSRVGSCRSRGVMLRAKGSGHAVVMLKPCRGHYGGTGMCAGPFFLSVYRSRPVDFALTCDSICSLSTRSCPDRARCLVRFFSVVSAVRHSRQKSKMSSVVGAARAAGRGGCSGPFYKMLDASRRARCTDYGALAPLVCFIFTSAGRCAARLGAAPTRRVTTRPAALCESRPLARAHITRTHTHGHTHTDTTRAHTRTLTLHQ